MIGRNWAVAGPALKRMADLNESTDELLTEARSRFLPRMDHEVQPMPGLLGLLDHVERAGLPRAVTTSSRRDYAFRLLDRHELTARFAFVLGSEDVERHKPDPEIYRRAAERFGVEPAELLVLEDTATGVAAGRAAGAYVVAVPHAFSPAEGLTSAHRIVQSLGDPDLHGLIRRL
jgi:HAD superfamily hydrolase (TIGR01509 family)